MNDQPVAGLRSPVSGLQAPVSRLESAEDRPEPLLKTEDRGPETEGWRPKTDEAAQLIRRLLASATRPCITCSFQAEDVAVLHLLLAAKPDIPVLFLDTVHHFAQTYTYRDLLAKLWNLNLVNLRAAEPAPGLWQTSTDACCAKHKVEPLFSALEAHDLWFTGLRRQQSPSRANLAEVEPFRLPSGRAVTKVSPLAAWTTNDVYTYNKAHGVPLLPLYELGYTSIGCEPCTSVPLDPEDPRSGRWQGQKLECGIHIQPASK